MPKRLFIALELDSAVKEKLERWERETAASISAASPAGISWQKGSKLHLTLKFLGEVPEERTPRLTDVLEGALREIQAFELHLEGAGCFPLRGPVRIIWIGVKQPNPDLARCFAVLETSLAGLGFKREERDFHPHITAARVKNDPAQSELRRIIQGITFAGIAQQVKSITLFSSELNPSGSVYSVIKQFEFFR